MRVGGRLPSRPRRRDLSPARRSQALRHAAGGRLGGGGAAGLRPGGGGRMSRERSIRPLPVVVRRPELLAGVRRAGRGGGRLHCRHRVRRRRRLRGVRRRLLSGTMRGAARAIAAAGRGRRGLPDPLRLRCHRLLRRWPLSRAWAPRRRPLPIRLLVRRPPLRRDHAPVRAPRRRRGGLRRPPLRRGLGVLRRDVPAQAGCRRDLRRGGAALHSRHLVRRGAVPAPRRRGGELRGRRAVRARLRHDRRSLRGLRGLPKTGPRGGGAPSLAP